MKKLLILSILFISCKQEENREDINCKYQGGIIYDKQDACGSLYYDIKYKGEIVTFVNVYQIDFNYNVGDTISKPCRN